MAFSYNSGFLRRPWAVVSPVEGKRGAVLLAVQLRDRRGGAPDGTGVSGAAGTAWFAHAGLLLQPRTAIKLSSVQLCPPQGPGLPLNLFMTSLRCR